MRSFTPWVVLFAWGCVNQTAPPLSSDETRLLRDLGIDHIQPSADGYDLFYADGARAGSVRPSRDGFTVDLDEHRSVLRRVGTRTDVLCDEQRATFSVVRPAELHARLADVGLDTCARSLQIGRAAMRLEHRVDFEPDDDGALGTSGSALRDDGDLDGGSACMRTYEFDHPNDYCSDELAAQDTAIALQRWRATGCEVQAPPQSGVISSYRPFEPGCHHKVLVWVWTDGRSTCDRILRPCARPLICAADGTCQPSCDPQDASTCPSGWCNPDTTTCAFCTTDTDCPSTMRCNVPWQRCEPRCTTIGTNACERGACNTTSGQCEDCSVDGCPAQNNCNPSTGVCEPWECSGDEKDECAHDEFCRDHRCVRECDADDPASCSPYEECRDGGCETVHQEDGMCPPPYVTEGTSCRVECTVRNYCTGTSVCDGATGRCRSACLNCNSRTETCQLRDGTPTCVDLCEGFVCPPGEHCGYGYTDVNTYPMCVPDVDQCEGVQCPEPQICINGVCQDGGFDPCAGVFCPFGQCVDGQCVSTGCVYDTDCWIDETCYQGQCIPTGSTCVLDGICDADETCACDAFCCGGGGGGGGSGGGETCTYTGGPTITYSQCAACGGTVVDSHTPNAYCDLPTEY